MFFGGGMSGASFRLGLFIVLANRFCGPRLSRCRDSFNFRLTKRHMRETHSDGLHADPDSSFHSSLSTLIRPPWTTALRRSRLRASV